MPTKTETRIENATKLIEFLETLGLDDNEKRKVLSRTYTTIAKRM